MNPLEKHWEAPWRQCHNGLRCPPGNVRKVAYSCLRLRRQIRDLLVSRASQVRLLLFPLNNHACI